MASFERVGVDIDGYYDAEGGSGYKPGIRIGSRLEALHAEGVKGGAWLSGPI
jgi:hypothetical protein